MNSLYPKDDPLGIIYILYPFFIIVNKNKFKNYLKNQRLIIKKVNITHPECFSLSLTMSMCINSLPEYKY